MSRERAHKWVTAMNTHPPAPKQRGETESGLAKAMGVVPSGLEDRMGTNSCSEGRTVNGTKVR